MVVNLVSTEISLSSPSSITLVGLQNIRVAKGQGNTTLTQVYMQIVEEHKGST